MNSTIHAVVVGIDAYPDEYGQLSSAVKDAKNIATCLQNTFNARPEDVTLLTDQQATKSGIVEAISSLESKLKEQKLKRNDPIIFYFSGYGGRNDDNKGLLCPVDMDKNVLSVEEISQIFAELSRSCGNNITVLLDCPALEFAWGSLSSCVVIAPDVARETPAGGVFTQAIIKVLNERKEVLKSTSVDAFAAHLQAAMDDVDVRAFGVNIDRPLFNLKEDPSFFAFIPCRTSKDGRILLCAGAAHGVQKGAVYGCYETNILVDGERPTKLGTLTIDCLNSDDLTATFVDRDATFPIPRVFYACEENSYCSPIKISSKNTDAAVFQKIDGWVVEGAEKAHLKAPLRIEVAGDDILFRWTGLPGETKQKEIKEGPDAEYDDYSWESEPQDLQRTVHHIARFRHFVSTSPPSRSSIASKIQIFLEPTESPPGGTNKRPWITSNFESQTLPLEIMDDDGPYCLRFVNKNAFPVWPFVFLCDPNKFTIRPFYLPPAGLDGGPLRANGGELTIGQENEQPLLLQYRSKRDFKFTYLKLFVTKERTEFSFLQQAYVSETENQLRGYDQKGVTKGDNISQPSRKESVDTKDFLKDKKKQSQEQSPQVKISHWASALITILLKFKHLE